MVRRSRSGFALKHATPKMKGHYLAEYNALGKEIRRSQQNPTEREAAIDEIKRRMADDIDGWMTWWNKVYQLRAADKNTEYSEAIFAKLEELREKEA